MKLRGIPFSPVFQASGVTNLDCGGYWFHRWLRPLGLNFTGTTKVTKTTPLLARPGNMPLKRDGVTPKEWLPKCVIIKRKERAVLNAVSLSSPGLGFCINAGWWQKFREPFFISIMSVAKTAAGRMAEYEGLLGRLAAAKKYEHFHADWGIQWNFSCPNLGLDPNALIEEVVPALEKADKILPDIIPVMVKFGPEVHPSSMLRIAKARRCDAVTFCNTLPFGRHPTWSTESPPIDWKSIFGTDSPEQSPMTKRFPGFPGGYSGAGLRPFVLEWLRKVRALHITTPICAGGGLLDPADPGHYFDAGGDAVALGSIATLNPTKVGATIRSALHYCYLRADLKHFSLSKLEYNV